MRKMWKIFLILELSLSLVVGTSLIVFGSPITINLRHSEDPRTLDPTLCYAVPDYGDFVQPLFLPLVEYDYDKMESIPALATSWEVSEDGTTWTFHLRKDVKWSDGNPVTAHDVEYGIKRVVDPGTGCPWSIRLYCIKGAKEVNTGEINDLSFVGVKTLDDYTLQIDLVHPAGYFLSLMPTTCYAIPRWTVEKYGDKWTDPENIVTNGPYLLKKWSHYNEIVLVKNPNYFDADNVQIEEIHFFIIRETSTAMAMYETGELDCVEDVLPEDIERIKADPVLSKEYHNGPRHISYQAQFNNQKPPFDNVLVRKAFAAAVDREAIVKYVTKGGEQPALTFTMPGCFGYTPPEMGVGIPYDPEAARKYLAEAGYPGGKGLPEVTYCFNTSEFHRSVAEAMQQMWKNVLGVNVKLRNIEDRVYWDRICAHALQFWRMGREANYPDAHSTLYEGFHSKYSLNNLQMFNDEYDRVLEEAAVEFKDPEKRKALYQRAEKILCEEECATIPLWWYAYNIVTKPYLKRTYSPGMGKNIKDWRVEK